MPGHALRAAPPARVRPVPVARARGQLDSAVLFVLYVVSIPLSPQFELFGIPDIRVSDLLLVLTIIAISLEAGNPASKAVWRPPPLVQLMGAVIFWSMLRIFVLPDYDYGSPQMLLGFFYCLKRVEYFTIFLVVYWICLKPNRVSSALTLLQAAAIGFNLLVMFDFYRHLGEPDYRASGFGTDQPNQAAIFIVGVATIAIASMVHLKKHNRALSITVLITSAPALIATASKEGLVCAVVIGCFASFRKKAWGLLLTTIIIGAVLLPFFPTAVRDRFSGMGTEAQVTWQGLEDPTLMPTAGTYSLSDRVLMVQYVVTNLLPECFWTGLGMGSRHLGANDDFYLYEWVENGIVGLALFLWLLRDIWQLIGRARQARDNLAVVLGEVLGPFFVILLLDGFASEVFYLVRPMELFFLLLGVLAAQVATTQGLRPAPAALKNVHRARR
ncbi:MAG: O-antigen ligase family protein [Candidatus Xenobia bacterium]